ncbi:YihY/virulence factor BrkB family protein [Candidatus Jidaibacter acanthamoebae]|nr:YihY/virulence factor BrkB family protein [Candidatus Jidaibacter acanthamoeba]
MKSRLKTLLRCFYKAIYDTVYHEGVEHAGYMAFLLMLTIFPTLVFFVALVGFFGKQNLSELLVNLILESSWANFIEALKPRIIEITSSPPQSLLTIAIISALWTASSIFEGLRTILNKAYKITTTATYLKRRLISFLEFAGLMMITIILLVTLLIVPWIWNYVYMFVEIYDNPLINFIGKPTHMLRYLILIFFGFLLVSGLYYYLPNRKMKFTLTFPGTIAVLLGWAISSALFRLYLSYFPSINIIYGSIAGVIIALLYFYICSLIFIFGAEFNYQVETQFGLNVNFYTRKKDNA